MVEWTSAIITSVCVIFVLAALTMPAGIGGGILFVPVLRLVGGMTQSSSSALSQVLITGAALGSVLFQVLWQRRFPSEPMLMQPYFVVIMLPALLSGSLVGVYLSTLLPDVVCLIILVCLCAVSSVLIFKKGIETFRKENQMRLTRSLITEEQSATPPPIHAVDRGLSLISIEVGINVRPEIGMYQEIAEGPPLRDNSTFSSRSISEGLPCSIANEQPEKHSWLLDRLTRSIRPFIVFVASYWAFFALCTFLRGSRQHPSFAGVSPCGSGYWVVAGAQASTGVVLSLMIASREIKLISLTFITGLLATISGASGGIILNPMLLTRGLDPQQTSATSTIMLLVMASCSAFDFLINGRVEPIFASLMAVTLVGSVIGMSFVKWLVKALGRQSILVLLLGVLVVVGGFLLLYVGIKDVISEYNAGASPFAFGYLC